MLLDDLDGFLFILVFVFLVALLLVEVCADVGLGLVESLHLQFSVDFLCEVESVVLEVLKLDFHKIAFRD